MAAAKASLTRDSTMKVTAKEAVDYLKSEGRQDLLKAQGLVPDVHRDNTMVSTAKEGQSLLASMGGLDADATTRGQQRQLEAINAETPPTKKSKLARDSTMAVTAKDSKAILGAEKFGDTRQATKRKRASNQRQSTIQKTIAESQYFVPKVDAEEGRRTRAQARGETYKPPQKKERKPAKGGGAKRGRKPKADAE